MEQRDRVSLELEPSSLELLAGQVLGALNSSVETSWWQDRQGAPSVVTRS